MTIEENKNGLEPVELGIDHKPSQEDIMIIDKTFVELLIIEDNEYKLDRTVKDIQKAAKDFPQYMVDYRAAKSFFGARRLIKETKFDGYVIDMQFPNHDDEMPEMRKGIELIHFLNYSMNKTPRVVNTSSEDSRKSLEEANLNETLIINDGTHCCIRPFYHFLEEVINAKESKKS
jgi:hypothetical protein